MQRDIEAEEALRLVAEDADVQTSALKRAKELVLSRLGSQFSGAGGAFGKRGGGGGGGGGSGGGGGVKKESFGAGSFLSSARFREGLFGRSTPVVSGAAQGQGQGQVLDHRSMDVPILFSRG